MAGIDIRNFLNSFVHQQRLAPQNNLQGAKFVQPQPQSQPAVPPPLSGQAATQIVNNTQNLQMNTLQSIDRAIYAKDVLGIPKNLNEFIYMLQRGMTQGQFNQMFSSQLAYQKNSLSQLQAQILAQLQGLDVSEMQAIVSNQLTTQLQSSLKNLEILSNGMINLNQISQLIQINGKDALTKIIMAMTEASKSGITDLSQLKDMARLINASISVAAENDSAKTMKLLLLLYLPWLPLKEGVDFDLEIETKQGAKDETDSILTVTITTINYGTVIATLMLETSNSVQMLIECSEKFPKEELQMRIDREKKHYSMEALTTFRTKKEIVPNSQNAKASVNMSQTTEINPYLLLSAHSIIRHVIDIDNNTSLGLISHVDEG